MKREFESFMRQHWDELAEGYSQGRDLSAVDMRVMELLNMKAGQKMLEIGFGSGTTAKNLVERNSQIDYFGLDLSLNFINIARRRLGTQFKPAQGNALMIPFKNSSFDFVLEMDAIHHFPSHIISDTVKEIFRILKPGGTFISAEDWGCEPSNEREVLARKIQDYRHLQSRGLEYHPTDAEWLEIFRNAGFAVQEMEHCPRSLDLAHFDTLEDEQAQEILGQIRQAWGDEKSTTKMTIFICGKE